MTLEIHLSPKGQDFLIQKSGCAYFEEGEFKILSGILGARKVRSSTATFLIPGTAYHAGELNALAIEKTWEPDAAKFSVARLTAFQRVSEALSNAGNGYRWKLQGRKLFGHQLSAMAALMIRDQQRMLIADEMGLGKSTTALAVFNETAAKRCLIVCPASVKYNWLHEIDETLGPTMAPFVIPSDKLKRKRFIAALLAGRMLPNILITNYDLLRDKAVLENCRSWIKDQFLILDESHYVKDCKSLRSQHVASLEPKHLLLLTGTPVRNLITDLYHQLALIEPRLFRNYWEFQDRFTITKEINVGPRKVKKIVGTKNQAKLKELLAHYQIRRLKHDVLDLPPKIRTVVELDLDEGARLSYEAMRKDWIYTFGGLPDDANIFDVRVQSAIEQAMRLEQICQGYMRYVPQTVDTLASRVNPEEDAFFANAAKTQWLLELVTDLQAAGKKLVVFFKFNRILHHVAALIEENLKVKTWILEGATPVEQRPKMLTEFQEGNSGVLCAQVKIAEGWNAQSAQDVVFFGRDWSPAVNAQAEDRLHRIGQRGTVNVYIPLIRNSVESYIHERLEAKAKDASIVLGDSPLVFRDIKQAIQQGECA